MHDYYVEILNPMPDPSPARIRYLVLQVWSVTEAVRVVEDMRPLAIILSVILATPRNREG